MCCSISASFCNYTVQLVHFIFLKLSNKNILSVQILIRTFYCKERPRKPCFFFEGGRVGRGRLSCHFPVKIGALAGQKLLLLLLSLLLL